MAALSKRAREVLQAFNRGYARAPENFPSRTVFSLKKKGLLERSSNPHLWQITEKGKEVLRGGKGTDKKKNLTAEDVLKGNF